MSPHKSHVQSRGFLSQRFAVAFLVLLALCGCQNRGVSGTFKNDTSLSGDSVEILTLKSDGTGDYYSHVPPFPPGSAPVTYDLAKGTMTIGENTFKFKASEGETSILMTTSNGSVKVYRRI